MPDPDLPAVLARRARAAVPRAGSCRVIAIDGPSGAGKSTLAEAVADELGAQVLSVDDLMPGWDGLEAALSTLHDVLEAVADGRDGSYRRYDWVEDRFAERRPVPASPYLVLEGCGSGSRALAPYLSLLVWLDAEIDVRFERAIGRDGETFLRHWDRWEEETRALFAREGTAERADVVLDVTDRSWDEAL